MRGAEGQILTVGHSTHQIDAFIDLLARHNVTAIADVRSTPASSWNPQFNREAMERSLRASGIKYAFLGRELGARSDDPGAYVSGRVQYSRLASSAGFRAGIEKVLAGAGRERIALMCAEREPLDCHRAILIGAHLVDRGIDVAHICADGSLEPHAESMRRLRQRHGLGDADLFHTMEELTAEALARQEAEIAYIDKGAP